MNYDNRLAQLRALAAELETAGLRAELGGADAHSPRLDVASTHAPVLSERITFRHSPGQPAHFCWSSRQPIGPADDPPAAAAAIASVPRPLEDAPGIAAPDPELDQSAPNSARIYDYLLGGCFL